MPILALQKSVAWRKSMMLAKAVYSSTRSFTTEERFGLTGQLRRAAVSVPSNIAEGRGRLGKKEFLHFLCIARGSVYEIDTQAELAIELGYGDEKDLRALQNMAAEMVTILNASVTTLQNKIAAARPHSRLETID